MKHSIWVIEQKEEKGWFPLLYSLSSFISGGPEFILTARQINYKTKEDAKKALKVFPEKPKHRVRKYTSEGK